MISKDRLKTRNFLFFSINIFIFGSVIFYSNAFAEEACTAANPCTLTFGSEPVSKIYTNSDTSTPISTTPLQIQVSGEGSTIANQIISTGAGIDSWGKGSTAADIKLTVNSGSSIKGGLLTDALPPSCNDAGITGDYCYPVFNGYQYLKNDHSQEYFNEKKLSLTKPVGPIINLLLVGSGGTPGLGSVDTARNADLYRGGDGGSVDVTVGSDSSVTTSNFTLNGTTTLLLQMNLYSSTTFPLSSVYSPLASALFFNSSGGDGGVGDNDWYLDAGNGGNVTANLYNSNIALYPNDETFGQWVGITASSMGGDGGMGQVGAGRLPIVTDTANTPYTVGDQSYFYNALSRYGKNGSGGNVSLSLNKTTIVSNYSSDSLAIVGISASSLGGARPVNIELPGGSSMRKPGSGGDVTVILKNSSSIALTNSENNVGAVGIYAASGTKPFYILTGITDFTDDTPKAGKVTVNIDSTSSIEISDGVYGLNAAVFASSTGGAPLDAWTPIVNTILSQDFGPIYSFDTGVEINPLSNVLVSSYDLGAGGQVEVTNDGKLTLGTNQSQNQGIYTAPSGTYFGVVALSSAGLAADASGSTGGFSWGSPDGADVTVTNNGIIEVSGSTAVGIYAASLGGGGLAKISTLGYANGAGSLPLSRLIGNYGTPYLQPFNLPTDSSDGQSVTVNNAGIIRVGNQDGSSLRAYGILASSIGSGGGLVIGNGSWFHGSNGAIGGNGGDVSLTNSGLIFTIGDSAAAVVAQSIGGGGGAGGSEKGFFVALGGNGGAGGDGGSVTIDFNNNAQVKTYGDYAVGVIAHSIGGGGGHGGSAKSIGTKLGLSIGGVGGVGGDGGVVSLNSSVNNTFQTYGQHAHGIVLQSIGGGGGVGASSNTKSEGFLFSSSVALGGKGGVGGDGGIVQGGSIETSKSTSVYSNIATNAHDSTAIILQTIGGGGGLGGSAAAKSTALSLGSIDPELQEIPAISLSFALGGTGGAGGKGGAITYWHLGNIGTYGDSSYGIMAQSIGGGGGSGGDGTASAKSVGQGTKVSLSFGLGGQGATGSNGGDTWLKVGQSSTDTSVTSTVPTFISTIGHDSIAVFSQSIGGGGGSAGTSSGLNLSASYTPSFPDDTLADVGKGADDVADMKSVDDLPDFVNDPEDEPDKVGNDTTAKQGDTSSDNSSATKDDSSVTKEDKSFFASLTQCLKKSIITGKINITGCDEDPEKNQSPKSFGLDIGLGVKGGSGGDGGNVNVYNYGWLNTNGSGSHAIFAQSVGGGGGKASAAGADAGGSDNYSVTINVGGNGGGGGTTGKVEVYNAGVIVTGQMYDMNNPFGNDATKFTAPAVLGGDSHGIFAQSIGGGGGLGGNADPNSGAPASAIVDLLNGKTETAALTALGVSSDDINDATSGVAALKWLVTGKTPLSTFSFSPTINVGGAGGIAGDGGEVVVYNDGQIQTYGSRSFGIFAQSIGGGGGSGGSANGSLFDISASETLSGIDFSPSINVGGSGNAGGTGGEVTIYANQIPGASAPLIITRGYASYGMMAQSIGGGGGVAHEGSTFGLSDTIGVNGNVSVTGSAAFGNGQSTATYSAEANSANTKGSVKFGTQGSGDSYANSGAGGKINLGTTSEPLMGYVITHGNDAMAVFGQSIGGGGGLATLGCSNASPTSSSHYASACWGNTTVSGSSGQPGEFVGGAGTGGVDISINGGNSVSQDNATGTGAINVYSNQSITTYGDRSMGLVTQNITGGGGFFSAPNSRINSVKMPSQPRALNSSPGAQTINLNGSTITTHGDGSWGVFAQMVQGGGGFFGDSSQDLAFNVKYDLNKSAAKDLFVSRSGSLNPNIAQFSQNQISDVHTWDYSSCTTVGSDCMINDLTAGLTYKFPYTDGELSWNKSGDEYIKIFASLDPENPYTFKQYNSNGTVKYDLNKADIVYVGDGYFFVIDSAKETGVLYSSSGAEALTAGSWLVTDKPTYNDINNLFLSEYGGALGTLIGDQTYGGNIGTSMLVDIFGLATSNSNLGWTNNPMTVSLNNTDIYTYGDNSHGVVLQNLGSVGGAWSANGSKLNMGITLDGADSSGNTAGGAITLNMIRSTIAVSGEGSRGVVIQSDGGGPGGTNNQGIVTVKLQSSSITSLQHTALMVLGSSYSADKPSTITVDATSSIINFAYQGIGASSGPALINGGAAAAADNTDAAYNQWAVYAPTGYTNLTNNGTIYGNILLGIMTRGDFQNNGTLHASTVLVAENSLHNYGSIYPGGDGNVGVLSIYGSLKHYDVGDIQIDINSVGEGATNDQILVSGLARIDGEFVPQTQSLMPRDFLLLSAGSIEYTGSIRDSLVFDWSLNQLDNTLTAKLTADFTPAGVSLTGNAGSLANYIQRQWDGAGKIEHAKLFAYIHEHDQGDTAGYQNTLNQLSGQVLNSQAIQMKTVFATALTDSLSCPMVTEQGLKLNQSDCVWAQITGSLAEQSANSSNSGYNVSAGGIRLGAQKQVNTQWTSGFALGYANNYLTSTGLTSNGQFFNASVSLTRDVDQWSFGGSLGLAYGSFDNNRTPQLGANGAAAAMSDLYTSSANMAMVGMRFRTAYTFERADHYIKPYVDLDLIYSSVSGYTESGSGPLALKANSSNQFNVAISPMVEFGTDMVTDGKRRIKSYVSAGASFLPNNNVSTQMAFANGMAGTGTYDVITNGPSVLGRLNLGIQAFEANDLEVRAQYGLQVGDGYWSQSLSANLVYRF